MILRMGWRNLFRNKRRTLLTSGAIAVGLAGLMFMDAVILGMAGTLVGSATQTILGEAQIHAEGFRDRFEADLTVRDWPAVEARLASDPQVMAYAPRTVATAMLASAADALPVLLYGVDPAAETRIGRLPTAVTAGRYLDASGSRNALIGARAAERLGVDVGDRLVLTMSQAGNGQLVQELFRVGGIYRFGTREMDERFCFIPLGVSQALLDVPGRVHEVAVRFKGPLAVDTDLAGFKAGYGRGGNEAKDWRQLMPALHSVLDISRFASLVVAVILMLVVSLAIMNTLFMALHERVFEFGVMKALGTRPLSLGAVILAEAAFMAAVSTVGGSALGTAVNLVTARIGIDYSGVEFAGVILDRIRPVLRVEQYTWFPVGVVVFTVLVAVYPAWHAARRLPSAALRKTL